MPRQQSVTTTLPRYQWSANEYRGMIEAGVFDAIKLLDDDVVITGAACKPYRWTLEDYEQLVALGLLEDKHVELMQGEILVMAPMGEPHALTIMQLNEALGPLFNTRTGYRLRTQMPLALPSLICEPEPDLAVVRLNAPIKWQGAPPVPCSS
jgi:Uma2 family endonuclease